MDSGKELTAGTQPQGANEPPLSEESLDANDVSINKLNGSQSVGEDGTVGAHSSRDSPQMPDSNEQGGPKTGVELEAELFAEVEATDNAFELVSSAEKFIVVGSDSSGVSSRGYSPRLDFHGDSLEPDVGEATEMLSEFLSCLSRQSGVSKSELLERLGPN